ncbi:DUF86 domain-containing protein [Caldimonas caldifontis]|uniref:DUF86 domain-containing protein n=1 Tax=Caldimonas caldifontis TaxID=1452508 RepID=A0A2S5SX30_9BURK|nr:DUF86 domain-containing protein [Caldimonas caldifontis]PPE67323.1 hypothetical protein C1704_03935 [Caldimonas caldifontis]
MSRDKQRLIDYLTHILDAIERIERYTTGLSLSGFLSEAMVQDAVIRNLEVIGEACHNIEKHHTEFATAHTELPLAVAYQMRNAVSHGYFNVDLEMVWATTRADLPRLHQQVKALLLEQLHGADEQEAP